MSNDVLNGGWFCTCAVAFYDRVGHDLDPRLSGRVVKHL